MAQRKYSASLQGKTAVVCGSDSSLGYHLVSSLAKHGCNLVLVGRAVNLVSVAERLAGDVGVELADEGNVRQGSGKNRRLNAGGIPGRDVKIVNLEECADGDRTDAAAEEAWRAFGSLDILLHTAFYRGVFACQFSPLWLSPPILLYVCLENLEPGR